MRVAIALITPVVNFAKIANDHHIATTITTPIVAVAEPVINEASDITHKMTHGFTWSE